MVIACDSESSSSQIRATKANGKKCSVGDYVWSLNNKTVEPRHRLFEGVLVSADDSNAASFSEVSTFTEEEHASSCNGPNISCCNASTGRIHRISNNDGCVLAAQVAAAGCEQGQNNCRKGSDTLESFFSLIESATCGDSRTNADNSSRYSESRRSRSSRSSRRPRRKVSSSTLLNLRNCSVMEKSKQSEHSQIRSIRNQWSDDTPEYRSPSTRRHERSQTVSNRHKRPGNEAERPSRKGNSGRVNGCKELRCRSSMTSTSTSTPTKGNRTINRISANTVAVINEKDSSEDTAVAVADNEQEIVDEARKQAAIDIAAKVEKVVDKARVSVISRIEKEMNDAKRMVQDRSESKHNNRASKLLTEIEEERRKHIAAIEKEMELAKQQILAQHEGTAFPIPIDKRESNESAGSGSVAAKFLQEVEEERQKQIAIAARIEQELEEARKGIVADSEHRRKSYTDWIKQEIEEATEKKRIEEERKAQVIGEVKKHEEERKKAEEDALQKAKGVARRIAAEEEARKMGMINEETSLDPDDDIFEEEAARLMAEEEARLKAEEQKKKDARIERLIEEEVRKKKSEDSNSKAVGETEDAVNACNKDENTDICSLIEENRDDKETKVNLLKEDRDGVAGTPDVGTNPTGLSKCINTIARTLSSTLDTITSSSTMGSAQDGHDLFVYSRSSTISSIGSFISVSHRSVVSRTQEDRMAEIIEFFTQLYKELSGETKGQNVHVMKGLYFLACLVFYLFWPENLKRRESQEVEEEIPVIDEPQPVKKISLLDLALD